MSSPHDILNALQQLATDASRVPALEAELKQALLDREQALRHTQNLETNIIGYKQTIDGLNEKLRRVEAERDDAGFRHLEAEDKLGAAIRSLNSFRADIKNVLGVISPPTPVEPAPAPTSEQAEAPRLDPVAPVKAPDWTPSPVPTSPSPSPSGAEPIYNPPTEWDRPAEANEGREAQPGETAQPSPLGTSYPSPATSEVGSTTASSAADPSPPQPYAGMHFWEVPASVNWEDFIKGGGRH